MARNRIIRCRQKASCYLGNLVQVVQKQSTWTTWTGYKVVQVVHTHYRCGLLGLVAEQSSGREKENDI